MQQAEKATLARKSTVATRLEAAPFGRALKPQQGLSSSPVMMMMMMMIIIIMMRVALWVKPQSLGLADQKVGSLNPRNRVSSLFSVSAPANLAVRKHVKVQVDK
ncbi:Hypothetical predicted protein [Podarcis lilfordi]|uniref:Uncharacterized protein n=1 Tax=Podarcis lilfordi TaxID=74358 RepID=A0AA35P341_9SAUR|nr:Hypothetical predicted protein [Podarcis lilfordi]